MKFTDLVLVAGALEKRSYLHSAWPRGRDTICNGAIVYSNDGD